MTTGQGNRGKAPGPARTPRKARATAQAAAITEQQHITISDEEMSARLAFASIITEALERGEDPPASPFGPLGSYKPGDWDRIKRTRESVNDVFPSKTNGIADPKNLVGLAYLQSIVLDEKADPRDRAQAAQKLTTFERHALEVIDDKQLYRQPRSAIQAEIVKVKAALLAQGLEV